MLIANRKGHYHFLRGIEPYSAGVISDPGFEIVHVTLQEWVQWRQGFEVIDAHLNQVDVERNALCGIELRSPAPFTMQGFIDFNRDYCEILKQWDLYIDAVNPIARTNVAPQHAPPETPVLHGFSYVIPIDKPMPPTVVIAGAGEVRHGELNIEAIIRSGETDSDALQEKAMLVMKVMEERIDGLGASWNLLKIVNIYTVHPIDEIVESVILPRIGPARRYGIHWHHTHPPVVDIEFEMDMRGARQEIFL